MDNGSAGEDNPAQPTVQRGVGGSRRRRAGRAPLKESEKMWVASTILLILFLVLSPQLFVLLPYFILDMPYTPARTLFTLAKLLIPFNIGAVLILINYYKCVTMDPGSPPQDWEPPQEVLSTVEAPRSCRTCKGFKPPRAHHCRTCKRCVLRMDHHCPWIANCVGHHNYASFIRFLAAVDVTCAYHLVLCTLRIADYWWTNEGAVWRRPGNFTMTILVLNFCLCIPTFLLVGSFSLYHFWCLCTNTTTIEGWEKDKVETLISKRRIEEIDYPFDLGVMRNIQSVLGASPLHWCIPSTSCGTGLVYETGEDIELLEQYAWPPRDPRRDARGHKTKKAGSSSTAFTYGNNDFNPALRPGNQTSLRAAQKSAVPPWHPDFGKREDNDDEDPDEDAAQAAGVDTGESCVPPNTIPGSRVLPRRADDEQSSSSGSSSEEESAVTMTKSRVRRGSEGYEVRPKRYDVASAALHDGSYDDHSNEDDDEEEDDDLDDKIWEWRRQQEEEDRLRAMLEEEMRKSGPVTMHDPPADWSHDQTQGDVSASSSVLLPSQVMRRRSQWQQYLADGSPSRLVDEAGESEGSRT